jgi:isopenicillin N synthase-like dioxygenase/nicotinamidase-related amidase
MFYDNVCCKNLRHQEPGTEQQKRLVAAACCSRHAVHNGVCTALAPKESAMAEGIPIENSRPLRFALPNDAGSTALLMIDFQGDFCDDKDSFLGAMDAPANLTQQSLLPARNVLLAARRAGIHIIHTLEAHLPDLSDLSESKFRRSRKEEGGAPVIGEEGGNGRMLTRGSPCNGLRPEVSFQDGEIAIHKPGKGAFYDTELRARLEGVTHLIFCGVTTECCIQSTMREANDRGFDSILVEDATASCVASFKTESIGQLTAFRAIVACAAGSKDVIEALDKLFANRTSIPSSLLEQHAGLPVIDISPLVAKLSRPFADARRAVDADCLRCAREIDAACRRVGFFYILGHGIVPPLECARQLFALDTATKMTMSAGAGEGAGYEPSGAQILDEGRLGEGIDGTAPLGDRKESYIIGKTAPSQRFDGSDRIEGRWPDENGSAVLPGFKENVIAYHDNCEALLRTLLRGTALGLGLAADTFDCFTKDAMTKVRLLRYPACTEDPVGYANAHGCGTHTDWGALTLLAQDDVGGLEVYCENREDESQQWLPAPNIDGALLVNVGDMLKLWTGGRYRSAPHRVMKPGIDSEERHSIAVFYNCDHNAPIDPQFLMPNKEVASDGIRSSAILTAEEYILERVKGTYT